MYDYFKMINILGNKIERLSRIDVVLVGIFVISAVLTFTSLFRGILRGSQVQIEYLNSNENENSDQQKVMAVDVEGAVIRPGVYELPEGSRIKDVLIMAGGFSVAADRGYCEKNINLAQVIKDGQKIYVPFIQDTSTIGGYSELNSDVVFVNLNTATMAELDTLWGVGEARASTIVKNRPYNSVEEVVSKGGMTKQIFEKNRDRLVVF